MSIDRKEVILTFLGNTSLNGAAWIIVAMKLWLKVFWVIVISLGFCGLCVHTSLLVQQYLTYPVQAVISLTQKESLIFPSVSVCNLNPIKASYIKCTNKRGMRLVQDVSARFSSKQMKKMGAIAEDIKFIAPYHPNMIKLSHCKAQRQSILEMFPRKAYRKLVRQIYSDGAIELKDEKKRYKEFINKQKSSQQDSDSEAVLVADSYFSTWDEGDDETQETGIDEQVDEIEGSGSGYGASGEGPSYGRYDEISPAIETLIDAQSGNNDEDFVTFNRSSIDKLLSISKLSDLQDVLYLMDMPEELLATLGTNKKDFIVECSFNKQKCGIAKDFINYVHEKYGNCFTFNSGTPTGPNKTVLLRSTQSYGSATGLRLTLNIDAAEYLGVFSSEYGIKLALSEQGKMSFPEMDGIIASPGLKTSIGLKWKNTERLKSPYESNCSTHYPQYLSYLTEKFDYSMTLCGIVCHNHFLYQHCGCLDLTASRYKLALYGHESNYSRCDVFNATQRKCKMKVHEMDAKQQFPCKEDCAVECSNVEFETTISSSVWPTKNYERLKANNFLGKDKISKLMYKDLTSNETTDEQFKIQDNLVRLHVYFQQLNVQTVKEEAAYELIKLIADIGGIMGLYLGISVMTMIEFMQLPFFLTTPFWARAIGVKS